MQKLRQISFNGGVRLQMQFDGQDDDGNDIDVADADAWYAKQQAKTTVVGIETYDYDKVTGQDKDGNDIIEILEGTRDVIGPFLPPEHTVEDVPNPNHAKETRRDAIKAALSDDDFKDLMLDLAAYVNSVDNTAIRASIKTKVQTALQL